MKIAQASTTKRDLDFIEPPNVGYKRSNEVEIFPPFKLVNN
jgi:hypothetical protein